MKKFLLGLFLMTILILGGCGQKKVVSEPIETSDQIEAIEIAEEAETDEQTVSEESAEKAGPEIAEVEETKEDVATVEVKEEMKEEAKPTETETEKAEAKETKVTQTTNNNTTTTTNTSKTTDSNSKSTTNSNATTNPAPTAPVQPKTKTIQHALGSLEVPVNPTKIVTLSAQHSDHLLSLGIVPVGTISGAGGKEVDWLHNRMPGTKYIGHFHSPNIEMILGLKPDLILGVEKHNSKAYGSLSKIAPTVLLRDMEADWRQIFKYVAEVVGKEDVANAKLKEFDNRLSKGKSDLAAKLNNETVLFMRVHHKESRIFGTNSHIGKIAYGGLGLKAPSITPTNVAELPIALEKLPEFEVDHIFLFDTAKKENQDVIKEMQQNPIWKNTKAVQNGNVHLLGDLNDSKAGKSLVLYNLFVDGVLKGLLK